jgi:quercetin dioxygenase-like cupin family protein
MPLIETKDIAQTDLAPGVERFALLDHTRGSESITIAEVTVAPGAKTPVHYHPTEEAMVILEGQLDAILGEDTFPVSAGQIVVAPPTVKHGFVNNSNAPARLYGIHPVNNPVTIVVED